MKPVRIALSRTLPGPPAVVWRLITDWEHQDDWMLEASDFVVTSEHREGIGVTAEATVRIAGFSTRDAVRVSEWEPNRRLAIEHLGWVCGTGEIELAGLPDGSTHLDWVETLHPPLGVVGWLGMWMLRPWMAKVFRRDLRVLEGLVRAASSA